MRNKPLFTGPLAVVARHVIEAVVTAWHSTDGATTSFAFALVTHVGGVEKTLGVKATK